MLSAAVPAAEGEADHQVLPEEVAEGRHGARAHQVSPRHQREYH